MFSISPVEEGKNGQPKVTLQSGDGMHSCDVYLYGGTVTAWKFNGVEKLFVSPITPFNGVKAIRGGIPLVFPQFGRPDEVMPQHGFARTSLWELNSSEVSDSPGSCQIVLTLKDSDTTMAVWPHPFKLEYTVVLSIDGLRTSLCINNPGDTVFSCQTLLHTYAAVPAIEAVSVTGFQGCTYIDQLLPKDTGVLRDDREAAAVSEEVDRIYMAAGAAPSTVSIHHRPAAGIAGTVDENTQPALLMKIDRKAYFKTNSDGGK